MYQGKNTQHLKSVCQEKGFLIAAHRGSFGGNILQNSYLSYQTALLLGADCIEMDVSRSIDGVFYAFHNGNESLIWHKDCDIRNMHSREIDALPCYNTLSFLTEKHLERLTTLLPSLRGRCFINIDRAWDYWTDAITFLDSFDMSDQIIIKSPVDNELLQALETSASSIMYMPIIESQSDWIRAKSYHLNIVAVEVIIDAPNSPVLEKDFLNHLRENHVLLWANAIVLDDTRVLSGLMDDNHSIAYGPDTGWGKLIEAGFHILLTDWPSLLHRYRAIRQRKD